ncbi:MAG: COX15/CtaA family protein [Hyphomicrobiales bacterium]|nr:COX15/CtaA family protein [Hyphomicrobiales bacterium]
MSDTKPMFPSRARVLRAWLLVVAALVFAVTAVGGATRLTGSGLSIVEWRPVTGTLPPFTEAAWVAEFEKYKLIPQYQELNRGMSLDEFKFIYWWEWGHRLLGRLIGVAFLLPFLWFLWQGWIGPGLRGRLLAIFGLGALQGAVGWWMVASGLAERVSVSQYRLAFHLTLACVIFTMLLWVAQRLRPRAAFDGPPHIRRGAMLLVILLLAQIYLGALVAGLHAGLIYNTWPLIDGAFIPDMPRLFFQQPWWRNLFENTLTVPFNHRMMAYLLFVLAIVQVVAVARSGRGGAVLTGALAVAGAITLQAALGIVTLLHVTPFALALAHQAMAVLTLAIAVVHAKQVSGRRIDVVSSVRQAVST